MSASLPRPGALAGAAFGFGVLGVAAALGVPEHAVAPVAVVGLGAAIGAVVLSTPTLLVASELLGHPATPAALAAAPLEGFVRAGRVALWLGPVLLFFATAGNAEIAWSIGLVGVAGIGLVVGARRIVATKPAQPEAPLADEVASRFRVAHLAVGWAGLAAALALHLANRIWTLAA